MNCQVEAILTFNVKDVKDFEVVAGSPARFLRKNKN